MTQEQLINYLKENGCIVIRTDPKGYAVMRNVINGKMSGVSVPTSQTGNYRHPTVCRTCKTLGVNPPEEAKEAEGVINTLHENPPNSKKFKTNEN